jgi:hypothetical protein
MTEQPPEVYPLTWFRCRECGTNCLGDNAVAEHRAEHVQRGEGPPEWEVLDDE